MLDRSVTANFETHGPTSIRPDQPERGIYDLIDGNDNAKLNKRLLHITNILKKTSVGKWLGCLVCSSPTTVL